MTDRWTLWLIVLGSLLLVAQGFAEERCQRRRDRDHDGQPQSFRLFTFPHVWRALAAAAFIGSAVILLT